MKIIKISRDYSETLGARYITDGDFSGEDFRDNFLDAHFIEAEKNKEKLLIDLDGGYGNPVSFVEEAFGGLARKYGSDRVLNVLEFISNDEENLVSEINGYICHPETNQVYLHALAKKRGTETSLSQ